MRRLTTVAVVLGSICVIAAPALAQTRAVRDVAAGDEHTCAVMDDSTVRCWGDDAYGQVGDGERGAPSFRPSPVRGLTGASRVAAGQHHSCALLARGTVSCWGAGHDGQLGYGEEDDRAEPVEIPGIHDAIDIAAGSAHTCVIRRGGQVWCWGNNVVGQAGGGAPWGRSRTRTVETSEGPRAAPEIVLLPVRVPGVGGAERLSLSRDGSCALLRRGTVRCWGDVTARDPRRPSVGPVPRAVPTLARASRLAWTRPERLCAITARGLVCRSGDSPASRRFATVAGLDGAVEVAVADESACAVTRDRGVSCWGIPWTDDHVAGPTAADTVGATRVPGLSDVARVVLGQSHACALDTAGRLRCWGHGYRGQLANGYDAQRPTPVPVVGLAGIAELALGGRHSCARLRDGTVRCWGDNRFHQIDDGGTGDRLAPTPVAGVSGALALAAGGNHSCAVLRDGAVRCWGWNEHAQLGDGTQDNRGAAVRVRGLSDAVEVGCGAEHTCARLRDGTVRCWGRNEFAQLGDGTHRDRVSPVAVHGIRDASSLTVGILGACIVRADGSTACWGFRGTPALRDVASLSLGSLRAVALGRDGTTRIYAPTRGVSQGWSVTATASVPGVTSISAGGRHACVVSAGQVLCAGRGREGQLGSGSTLDRRELAPVPGITAAVSVAASADHTCALLRDRTAVCWGDNETSQLGDGTGAFTETPHDVVW